MKKQLLFACILICLSQTLFAQKYLVLDRYGMNRIKLVEGDEIWFSLKETGKLRYKDVISELQDSTLLLANRKTAIKLSDISAFYFRRDGMVWLSSGTHFIAGGFLISSAVHPLMTEPQYDQQGALVTSLGFLAIGQITRLFIRKKYKINENTRVRILDLSFHNEPVKTAK